MRFQVINSTISYSSPIISDQGTLALSFYVFPYERGTLEFSNGNRIVARDITEKLGQPLNLDDLFGKISSAHIDVLKDGGTMPITVEVVLTAEDKSQISYYDKEEGRVFFLRDEEFACGFAEYWSTEYERDQLIIRVLVPPDTLATLIQIIPESPSEAFLDIDIRGLADEPRGYWPGDFKGRWDLADNTDCGNGNYRVVTRFQYERTTTNFPSDHKVEHLRQEMSEDRAILERIAGNASQLVALGKGDVEGAVAKILLYNLFAVSTIAVILLLVLLALYF